MIARLLTMAACLVLVPASVRAQPGPQESTLNGFAQAPQQQLGRYVEFIVDDHGGGIAGGAFDFPTHPDVPSTVHFPEDIEMGQGFPEPHFTVDITGRRAFVYTTKQRPKPGTQRNITLTSGSVSVGLKVSVAAKPSDAIEMAFIRKRSEVEASKAALADLVARKAAQQANERTLDMFLESATMVRPTMVTGDVEPHAKGAADITLQDFEAVWMGPDDILVSFLIGNSGDTPFEWAIARAFGQDRTTDHAKVARVRTPALPVEGMIGRIPAGTSARGAIWVRNARQLSGPMTILLGEKDGMRPVMAVLDNWIPLQTRHSVRMWEFRPVEPPDPEKGRVAVHVQATGGLIFLEDGLGQNLVDATTLTGLGVRVLYGFNRYLAVEAAAMGATTGTARFAESSYQGMQGELTRSAGLGRLLAGAVVRLSYPTIPFLRLGVGLQGGSLGSVFTVSGNEVSGPESAFASDVLGYFGGGVERRFWGDFVAGLGFSAVFVAKTATAEPLSTVSYEAGVYLGYSWNP